MFVAIMYMPKGHVTQDGVISSMGGKDDILCVCVCVVCVCAFEALMIMLYGFSPCCSATMTCATEEPSL